jgi:glycosyltransferase involved in cell wall biosynthesis
MKIIHIVLGKANPERMNGINKVAYQLAKTQFEMGHQVSLWGIANSLEHNYPPRNFPTKLFRQLPNKLQLDPDLVEAVRRYPDEDTVFHIHGAFIPEFYHLVKLLRRRAMEFVYTPHGSLTKTAMNKSKWRKKIYFSLFERRLIEQAKAVQLLGAKELEFIDELVDAPHKVLIPNGVDLGEIPVLPEKKTNPFPIFTYCGRLKMQVKGLDLMLKGFHRLLAAGHYAQLEIIGDGEDRAALEEMARSLGIEKLVKFHGAKYGDKKYLFMNRGNLFLHTSRSEGFPVAVLEAAAIGLPCITSHPTNINRFIEKYGAGFPLLENHTPESVGEAMEAGLAAHRAGLLDKMGENAKTMVKESFDWRKICEQLEEVYSRDRSRRAAVA